MTVLDRLGGPVEQRAEVIAKLESRNPGGSIKDRTALGMVLAAEASGRLVPGARLVEPTAGNTGIGLALVGKALGYDVTLVMPGRYSSEKRALCCALGARVVGLPGDTVGMRECLAEARRIAADEGAVLLNQFECPSNPAIHELTTGVEMHEQCGEIDAVVLGVGTGGTLTGVVRALRRFRPDLEAYAVESQGSILGGGPGGPTRVEGIGSQFVPSTFDTSLVTAFITVSDDDAFATARDLAREEGIIAGASAGAIAFAALSVARKLGPGKRVATLIPDGGDRYWSKGLYPTT